LEKAVITMLMVRGYWSCYFLDVCRLFDMPKACMLLDKYKWTLCCNYLSVLQGVHSCSKCPFFLIAFTLFFVLRMSWSIFPNSLLHISSVLLHGSVYHVAMFLHLFYKPLEKY
jgi:hypothetical protein